MTNNDQILRLILSLKSQVSLRTEYIDSASKVLHHFDGTEPDFADKVTARQEAIVARDAIASVLREARAIHEGY